MLVNRFFNLFKKCYFILAKGSSQSLKKQQHQHARKESPPVVVENHAYTPEINTLPTDVSSPPPPVVAPEVQSSEPQPEITEEVVDSAPAPPPQQPAPSIQEPVVIETPQEQQPEETVPEPTPPKEASPELETPVSNIGNDWLKIQIFWPVLIF